MICKTDNDYKETKLIKEGLKGLGPPFSTLAAWIKDKYGVSVINITLDTIKSVDRPRLNVIFERSRDMEQFVETMSGHVVGYKKDRQSEIARAFRDIVSSSIEGPTKPLFSISRFLGQRNDRLKNVLVSFQDFEPIAISEANENVPEAFLVRLKAAYAVNNIWEISRFGQFTTVFFFTDAQLNDKANLSIREAIRRDYYAELTKHDRYGYVHCESFDLLFDSKENFDTKYKSSWFYYSR
jgi:hypothetical protein